METEQRSPLRVLAPVALVLFGSLFLLVIATSGGEEGGSREPAASETRAAEERSAERRRADRRERRDEGELPQKYYVVKTGDSLGSIAEKTGVPVERLQELNPELDPQALVSGQRIRLRE